MKIRTLIIGHGRGGKDTVAEILRELFGYEFSSSSEFAAREFMFDVMRDKWPNWRKRPVAFIRRLLRGYMYATWQECFEDRHNYRKLWHSVICVFNFPNKSRLAKLIMLENDIYVGMRDDKELGECIKNSVFDRILWVDGTARTGYIEPESSMNIKYDASYMDLITNSGSLEELKQKVIEWEKGYNER